MAYTQLPDGRWICYYRVRGEDGKSRVKKEYFGRGPEAEAAANRRDKELGLKKRRPRKETQGPAFLDVAESYVINKNFSDNSRKHLKIRLEANLLPFFKHMPAVKIRDQDVDNYVKKRRQDPVKANNGTILRYGVKESTIARELTDLKAILTWAKKRQPPLIPFNPIRDYQKPKEDNEIIPPPTQKETTKILKHASPHLIRAIQLSYYTGLRPGAVELLRLTWQDINWESKTILIRSAKKGGPISRLVPLHDDFIDQLNEWHKKDNEKGPIIHYRGKPVKSIKTAWKNTLDRAKITRRIRPYDLRHHFITQALEAGADIGALADVVGSSPNTLRKHYQHVTSEMHRKTVAKIPPLKFGK